MTVAERQRQCRNKKSSQQVEEARRKNVENVHRHRDSLSQEQSEAIRLHNTQQHRARRLILSPELAAEIQRLNTQQHRRTRDGESDEAAAERRRRNAERERDRRAAQIAAEHAAVAARFAKFILPNLDLAFDELPHFDASSERQYSCGGLTAICQFCRAKHFEGERASGNNFSLCCGKGRVRLPDYPEYPGFLRDAFTNRNNQFHECVRKNARAINASVSFVSMGAKVVPPPGRGPPVLRINGMTYHHMRSLDVPNVEDARFAQLFFVEGTSTQANNVRLNHPAAAAIDRFFLRLTTDFMLEHNFYARFLQTSGEQFRANAADPAVDTSNVCLVFNEEYRMPNVHPGCQNLPTDENIVAAVFELNDDGTPQFHRDFRIYVRPDAPHHPQRHTIVNVQSPHCLPLTYALLMPYGTPGWFIGWNCVPYCHFPQNRLEQRVSMAQFISALLQDREGHFNIFLHAGKLSQQFIVDVHLMNESNKLNFIRMNQEQLQAALYVALNRQVERLAARHNVRALPAIVLNSGYVGGRRFMRMLFLDAMSIFGIKGKPDYFITFTCNPTWPEILENILDCETAVDRPDITNRVFMLKLNYLIDLLKKGVFGPMVAFVYTIEFQKRGLPHAHLLVTVAEEFKPRDAAAIDRVVCAELPDREKNPQLFNIVSKTMLHTCIPERCFNAKGDCSKGFPKRYSNETTIRNNNYPEYRRRNFPSVPVRRGNTTVQASNAEVVPYCPFLTAIINAHINVEVITMCNGSVKYIYKYIFKGHDAATLKFSVDGTSATIDEINDHINARFVTASEGMWRILKFPTHGRSHAVMRLALHDEVQDEIEFDPNLDVDPERPEDMMKSTLTEFFALCTRDPEARKLLYTEVAKYFVWCTRTRTWQVRQQRGGSIVSRIREVQPWQIELFAMRCLLLCIVGPKSFIDLRTSRQTGALFASFNEHAQALNIVRDDAVFMRTLEDMAQRNLPPMFRRSFAIMLMNNIIAIANSYAMWERFRDDMTADFRRMPQHRDATDDELYDLALQDLNDKFQQSGRTCRFYRLPMPQGLRAHVDPPSQAPPVDGNNDNIVLNQAQQYGYDQIMNSIRQRSRGEPFVGAHIVIGPAGSGKTTLYKRLIRDCAAEGRRVKPCATTGIASMLMAGGMTAHRTFGLPINMDDQMQSNLINKLNCRHCQELRDTDVFLIDEITMMVRHGIRIIDCFLKKLMNNDVLFGGKIIVFGGDFRQLLPVVPGGSRPEIVTQSVISHPRWRTFNVIVLYQNMRSSDPVHNEWLLKLGTGSLPPVYDDPNLVEIPADLLLNVPATAAATDANADPEAIPPALKLLITEVFGLDIATLTGLDLATRAILAATIKQVMKINNAIIDEMAGDEVLYNSADDVISEHDSDKQNYPIEWLHKQTPSGIPPHVLKLKVGVVVMLLRNLDPPNGLSNGTRLIVSELRPNFIVADIISEANRGSQVMLPRMDLVCDDQTLPIKLRRQQFPILPAYAMTINKSQGQTIERVGIYLSDVVFSHGQLYVALSRCRDRRNITVYVKDQPGRQGKMFADNKVYTRNVVYREVFRHGEVGQPLQPDLEVLDPLLAAMMQLDIAEEAAEAEADDIIRQVIIPGVDDRIDDDFEGDRFGSVDANTNNFEPSAIDGENDDEFNDVDNNFRHFDDHGAHDNGIDNILNYDLDEDEFFNGGAANFPELIEHPTVFEWAQNSAVGTAERELHDREVQAMNDGRHPLFVNKLVEWARVWTDHPDPDKAPNVFLAEKAAYLDSLRVFMEDDEEDEKEFSNFFIPQHLQHPIVKIIQHQPPTPQ